MKDILKLFGFGFRIPKDGGVIPTCIGLRCLLIGWLIRCLFQNPEGWGCDSHSLPVSGETVIEIGFRIPKDGGVIPTSS